MGKNKKLIGYRKMAGFSQEDMASFVGMNRITYSRKETGKASFSDKEMQEIRNVLVKVLEPIVGELKITDIFF